MLIIKYVHFAPSREELPGLLDHITATAAQVEGLTFRGLYSSAVHGHVALLLDAERFEDYLAWLRLCPPPPGVAASHEVLLTPEEVGWQTRKQVEGGE